MAESFEEYEEEYRTEWQYHEVVHENEHWIIVADHTGHEINEWAEEFNVTRSVLSEHFHEIARRNCDYDWSVSDPIAFPKYDE